MADNSHPVGEGNRRSFMPAAILAASLPMWSSIGCAHGPRVSDPIPVAHYFASVETVQSGDVDALTIAPLGLHLNLGRYLSVDIVVEGPARQALKAADYLAIAARLKPDDWLEVVDPEGTKLRLTAARMPQGQYTSTAAYSVQVDESRSRLLVQAWSKRGMFERMRPGTYRVRLLDNPEYSTLIYGENCSVDTEWREFEIFRGSVAPSSLRDRPQVYLPLAFRAD